MTGPRAPRPWWWIVLSCVALLAGCAAFDRGRSPSDAVPEQLQDRQLIVTLASAPSELWEPMRATLARSYGLREIGAFPLLSIGVQCVVFQVPDDRSIEDVLARLQRDPYVASVQVNQVFGGLAPHGDPYASLQYGAHMIRAGLAHRWATGKGVRIAVVDTGVDTSHPDLRSRIVKTATFVEGGERTFTADSHGTAVAGIIAADADNGIGIFGVAPQAQIIVAKACWHRSITTLEAVCSSWTLAKALDFAITSEARILNLSLGGPPDPLLARLIGKALERGVTVVAAVMDHGSSAPGFPASLESVIAVLASDSRGLVRIPTSLSGLVIVLTLPVNEEEGHRPYLSQSAYPAKGTTVGGRTDDPRRERTRDALARHRARAGAGQRQRGVPRAGDLANRLLSQAPTAGTLWGRRRAPAPAARPCGASGGDGARCVLSFS